ncbi:MAG: CPBP family intramembrane metalloprotease [Anaerolineaceae bacterium]|nr:CPBP family intramembrane metalloprotease [Anaerolineaceae bacterium]
MKNQTPGRLKTAAIFTATIIIGYILFILPNLFFGITKINGGFTGVNLLITGLFQFVAVCLLIYFSLKLLKKDFQYIGLSNNNWQRDGLLGLTAGLAWAALQFGWLIPSTGGAARADIAQMIEMMDGTLSSLLFYIGLGVIGGGITEEIFNRGYFITVLKDMFSNPRLGLWVASILSILLFALGHLPTNAVEWFDILVPTIIYTVLFLFTKRLTAPIVAHGIYNMSAVLLTYYLYFS